MSVTLLAQNERAIPDGRYIRIEFWCDGAWHFSRAIEQPNAVLAEKDAEIARLTEERDAARAAYKRELGDRQHEQLRATELIAQLRERLDKITQLSALDPAGKPDDEPIGRGSKTYAYRD